MHVLKQSVPNRGQEADFRRALLKIKNDRGEFAAKGQNWVDFQRIPLAFKNIDLSDPVPQIIVVHPHQFPEKCSHGGLVRRFEPVILIQFVRRMQ